MFKILILKLCTPINFNNKRNATGSFKEIENFCKNLKKNNYQYTIVTSDKYSDQFDSYIDIKNYTTESLSDFDIVFCFNNTLNAYGGKLSINAIATYHMINHLTKKTNIPVLYCGADTQIKIQSLSDWINHKNNKREEDLLPYEYCSDKGFPNYFKDIKINELDINGQDLYLVSPVYQEDNDLNWGGKENDFKKVYHFPFYITHLHDSVNMDLDILDDSELKYDLLYYGNARAGKRTKKMQKFYNYKSDLKINMIGKLKPIRDKFKELPDECFLGQMNMSDLYIEIKKSLAHCYISDPQNENRMWTPRLFEAIMSRTIVFVDIDNDPNKEMFPEFFYVSSFKELESKVKTIKNNIEYRKELLDTQLSIIYNKFNNNGNLFETIFKDLNLC